MPKLVYAFGEDHAHQSVVGTLINRVADEIGVKVRIEWRSARRGHARAVEEFHRFVGDVHQQQLRPDLIVVATDANCKGPAERARRLASIRATVPVVQAIPDPHVERWLLVDSAAFKAAVGRGCNAPDYKCSRDRYKELLIRSVLAAGITPSLGGIEYAESIIGAMDLRRAASADASLRSFIEDLRVNL